MADDGGRWIRFVRVDDDAPVLINTNELVLVEHRPYDDADGTHPGMMVCGQHVKGDVDMLHLALGGESFTA